MSFRILSTRLEWVGESDRPAAGDVLLIPANEHLWMLSGPGLELKKSLGKEVEIDAVRLGPLEPGGLAVTDGSRLGFRSLYHAVVMGPDFGWIAGAGKKAMLAALARAASEKASVLVLYPLYRGVHGRREDPAREMLGALLEGLQAGSTLRSVLVLYGQPEEKALLHEIFLKLLAEPQA